MQLKKILRSSIITSAASALIISMSGWVFPVYQAHADNLKIKHAPMEGQTYKIAEPDMWKEIQRRSKKAIPWMVHRIHQLQKKMYEKPKWAQYLPPAKQSYSYNVSMEYTLKHSIPRVNEQGQIVSILYPKGFRFNILHHLVNMPPTLVIFNANRPGEFAFAYKYEKKHPYSMLITVDGSAVKLDDKYMIPVYYLPKWIVHRFRLRNTLAIITWHKKGGYAHVQVLAIRDEKSHAKK